MADNNNPFGMDPEDFDRFAREASDGLKDMVGKFFAGQPGPSAFTTMFDTSRRPRPEPPTTGETGAGVWAIFVVGEHGGARVEQVFAAELDALRANKHNTDPKRKVRFLPYGIAVSALDESDADTDTDTDSDASAED
ncbi:hypothetical protein AAFP30_01740 [Gordonia sp. CPCC 205515]|uniref:hypothetical protein n=1 Tax=Gordonia sp. CPCC 205515 TaxID=3140791 RepID=UPI003AF3B098